MLGMTLSLRADDAWLVPPGDVAALAGRMEQVLETGRAGPPAPEIERLMSHAASFIDDTLTMAHTVLPITRLVGEVLLAVILVVLWWRQRHSERDAMAGIVLAMLAVVILEPRGMFGIWLRLRNYFKAWPFSY